MIQWLATLVTVEQVQSIDLLMSIIWNLCMLSLTTYMIIQMCKLEKLNKQRLVMVLEVGQQLEQVVILNRSMIKELDEIQSLRRKWEQRVVKESPS